MAARYIDAETGHVLILWVRLADEEFELELGYEDDFGDEDDEDTDYPDWSF